MTNPMIRIHNLETNEIVDREMTDSEYQEFLNPSYLQDPEYVKQQAEQEAKAQQRAELFERLGLTEEEAKLLLG